MLHSHNQDTRHPVYRQDRLPRNAISIHMGGWVACITACLYLNLNKIPRTDDPLFDVLSLLVRNVVLFICWFPGLGPWN